MERPYADGGWKSNSSLIIGINSYFVKNIEGNKKARKRIHGLSHFLKCQKILLALAGFKTLVRLVDDIDTAAAFDNFAVTVAFFKCFQRVNDLHGLFFRVRVLNCGRTIANPLNSCQDLY